jgi:hypothetical protein
MRLSDLQVVNRRAINDAGARYMPGQDPSAPNLQIGHIEDAFDALALTQAFKTRIKTLCSDVRKAWGEAPASFRQTFNRTANSPDQVIRSLTTLQEASAEEAGTVAMRLRRLAAAVSRMTQRRLGNLHSALSDTPRDSDAHRTLDYAVYRVQGFYSAIQLVLNFANTPSFSVMGTNGLLVLGRWGTGKTHSLCDITEHRMSLQLPTLLCLGQQLPDATEPLRAICATTGLAKTPRSLLLSLQRLGSSGNGRALLIDDRSTKVTEGRGDGRYRVLGAR